MFDLVKTSEIRGGQLSNVPSGPRCRCTSSVLKVHLSGWKLRWREIKSRISRQPLERSALVTYADVYGDRAPSLQQSQRIEYGEAHAPRCWWWRQFLDPSFNPARGSSLSQRHIQTFTGLFISSQGCWLFCLLFCCWASWKNNDDNNN